MSYDKYAIQQAKEKGILENGVFDAKALEITEKEKKRLQEELQKYQAASQPKVETPSQQEAPQPEPESAYNVSLSFLDRVVLFFLALFGLQAQENYLLYKAMRKVYSDLSLIRPSIYNRKNHTVTRFFAYRLLDLYMKLLFFKPMFELMESPFWDNPEKGKTGMERLCEYLVGIDREQLQNLVAYEAILNRFRGDSSPQAIQNFYREVEQFFASAFSEKKEEVNKLYTLLMYMKNLVFYEFEWILKRFDSGYTTGQEAHFGDMPGEALLSYFVSLEEALYQIDLQQDFYEPFKALFTVYAEFVEAEQEDASTNSALETMKATFTSQLDALKTVLQEFMYKNYMTLLIRAIKKNPGYMPSFVHIRFDLVKKYSQMLNQRLKIMVEKALRQVKFETVEKSIFHYFPQVKSVGVYTIDQSKALEESGLMPFTHSYAVAILAYFFENYYQTFIRPILNTIITHGIFADEYFRRSVSDAFYQLDKFQTKLSDFMSDIQSSGNMGQKFQILLKRKETPDGKRSLEKHIVQMNGVAGDLFREFFTHFVAMKDIFSKIWEDTTLPMPKYLRNAHSIAGMKHGQYKEDIRKLKDFLLSFESILQTLREIPS